MRFLYLFFVFAIFIPHTVNAHVTKSDGDMKVMVHMDPDDDPIAGPPTTLHFLFRHAQSAFEMTNCNCSVRIAPYKDLAHIESKGDHIILRESMREASGSRVYSVHHSFPSKSVYAIVVQGSPKDGTSFKPFRIVFDKRVERSKRVLTSSSTLSLPYAMIGAGLVLLVALAWQFMRRQRQA